jgi:hypothetical protein
MLAGMVCRAILGNLHGLLPGPASFVFLMQVIAFVLWKRQNFGL